MIITPDPEDTADLAPKAAGSPDEKSAPALDAAAEDAGVRVLATA